jgi:ubiquinone biosynthesis protein
MGPAVSRSGDGPQSAVRPETPRRLASSPDRPAPPTALPLARVAPVYEEWGPDQWEQAQWPLRRTMRMLAAWVLRFCFLRWIRRRNDLAAQHVRALFEHLGGLWIEVGRLLSRRTDLFSSVYTDELARIEQPRLAVSFEVTRLLFEREFQVPIESEFAEFCETPMAVQPFAEVYRARLVNGQEVTVKVQRPDVPAIFARDMSILNTVVRIVEGLRIWPHLRWKELVWELEHVLTQESDLRYEAANLRRMRKKLRRHKIYVPRVYRRLCSARILTIEYLDAPTLRDAMALSRENSLLYSHWLKVNRISPKKIGKRLMHTFLRQVLEENLFHTNMSPDNVLLLRDGRLGLVGFSNVSSLEKYFLSVYGLSLRALSERDYVRVVDYLFLECDILPAVELSLLRVEIGRLLRAYESRAALEGVPYHEKSFLALSHEINRAMIRRRVVLSWQSVNISRAWMNLDDSLAFLLPDINAVKMFGEYFKSCDARRWKAVYSKGVGSFAGSLVSTITEQWMFFSAQLRKKAQVFQGVTSKASYFAALLLRFGARVGVLGVLAGLWVFSNEHLPRLIGRLHQTAIGQLTNRAPDFPLPVWIVILLMGVYVVLLLRRTSRRMEENEARLP